MRPSGIIACLLLAWASARAGLPVAETPAREARPTSVLLVVVDTLRADHLGSYGYFRATSPRMDALAAEGVRFAQAITVMPHTLPAHLSLFTSRYPAEHGVRRNGLAYDGRFPTLAELLAGQGYATAAFVSGAPVNSSSGLDRGQSATRR